jgi:hypothetical protein
LTIYLALFVNACATFKEAGINEAAGPGADKGKQRDSGITAVLVTKEARQIFGIDLPVKNIQAVWLARSKTTPIVDNLAADGHRPEYFAPLEVAFAYHKSFAADANAALDEHLLKLNFPIRNLDPAGIAGVRVHFHQAGQGAGKASMSIWWAMISARTLPFSSPIRIRIGGQDILDRMDTMFSAAELQNMDSEADLRQALEQLPCCVTKR